MLLTATETAVHLFRLRHIHTHKHTLDSRQQGNTVRSTARGREIKEER